MGLTTREVQQLMGIEPDAEDEARIRADERAKVLAEVEHELRCMVGCRVMTDRKGLVRDSGILEAARKVEEMKQ